MKNVQEYDGKDKEFERWLEMNPNGYVLNCYNTGKLHTALCKSYRSHGEHMTVTRSKACSTSDPQLLEYAKQEGIEAKRCQLCWGG